eukprot:scaffold6803_cov49-Attheya_sp.AAC.2
MNAFCDEGSSERLQSIKFHSSSQECKRLEVAILLTVEHGQNGVSHVLITFIDIQQTANRRKLFE